MARTTESAGHDGLLERRVSVIRLSPPYRRRAHLGDRAFARPVDLELPEGTLLFVKLASLEDHRAILARATKTLRTRWPTASLILELDGVDLGAVRAARFVGRLPIRAIADAREPVDRLRPVLTRPDWLGADVVAVLCSGDWSFTPFSAHVTRGVVDRALEFPRTDDLLDAVQDRTTRSARRRFRKEGLPSPGAWHQLGRGLRFAFRLQAEPGTPLLDLGLELGYADHSGLTRQLRRTFGIAPARIRNRLGWEWLLNRWSSVEDDAA